MTLWSVAGALALGLMCVEPALSQMYRFRSLSDAESAAARIMEAAGLRTVDFVVVVDEDSNNASASIRDHARDGIRRVINYDPLFLQEIERQTDEWGPIWVMAHEIAHHLLGHTVFGAGSNPPDELDADFYSGFILNRMGADLEQAQAGVRLIASPEGSLSHPPRDNRLEAIALGWHKAGEGLVARADHALEDLREELRGLEEQLRDAEGRFRDAEGRFRQAEDRYRQAEDRYRQVERERNEALEQLRQAQAEGGLQAERRRELEERVQETEDSYRQAEAERTEALSEFNQSRNRAEDAMARADRAFVLSILLVPLVLVALVLAMQKPRHEVAKVIERVSRRYRGSEGHEGGQWGLGRRERRRSDTRPAPEGPDGGAMVRPLPPAPPFDGSGLERCAEKGGLVLGRDAYLVDAVLNDASVSRRHARLTRHHGDIYIEDLNSANGTWVNGYRIKQFVPTPVEPGDAVTLGELDVTLWARPAAFDTGRS